MHLRWQTAKYVNSRKTQYTWKDLQRVLGNKGCTFAFEESWRMIVTVYLEVPDNATHDQLCTKRQEVERAAKVLHRNCKLWFRGVGSI